MRSRSGWRRIAVLLACSFVAVLLSSCGTYTGTRRGEDLTADQIDEGTRIRVHLVSGERFEDKFVRSTESELVCERQVVEHESVEQIEEWISLWWLWLGGVGALTAFFFISLNQALGSGWG